MTHRLDLVALPAVAIPLTADLIAAECIDSTGTTSLWLLRDPDAPAGCAGTCCAPHEGDGPMRRALRERLGLVHRCGAATHAGSPCRLPVPMPGSACAHHRAVAV